jgi:hypothetical protein
MHAGFSFSYSSISVLLRQPLSIKRAMQERYNCTLNEDQKLNSGPGGGNPQHSLYSKQRNAGKSRLFLTVFIKVGGLGAG